MCQRRMCQTQLVSFDQSNNSGAIDVKKDESVLEENSSLKMLGLSFSPKLDCSSYIVSTAKTAPKKTGALVSLYLYKSTIKPCMEY